MNSKIVFNFSCKFFDFVRYGEASKNSRDYLCGQSVIANFQLPLSQQYFEILVYQNKLSVAYLFADLIRLRGFMSILSPTFLF